MEFRCKICGGSLTVDPKTRIATCDYCGTQQVLPLFNDESTKNLYDIGNQYLLHNEYDKAEKIFNQLLSINPNEGEIYWNLVLCKYGVTYAKDPKTDKYIPTCNRTHTDSIFKDENYVRAIKLSSDEKSSLYKTDAEIINKIQKGILELSRKEKPFDVFISYKETDELGNRTRDSIVAQGIYEKLTEIGYKVFFSRITLESKIGEQYEPYIYAALSSSKVMITVCSSKENIQSAWVKNEWSRFLVMRGLDPSKVLIPVYFFMEEHDLPEEFALSAAQNVYAPGFEQELIRGIKKIIPISTEQKGKKHGWYYAIFAAALLIMLFGGFMMFRSAGSSIANKKIESRYKTAEELFQAGEYDQAKELFEELGNYENSKEYAVKCTYWEEFDKASKYYYDHRYAEAVWALQKIGDYPEVNELLDKSTRKWREKCASIAITPELGSGEYGSYYINPNGTVCAFPSSNDRCNNEYKKGSDGEFIESSPIELNEHGGIVSLGSDFPLLALHEDGYVTNSAYCNSIDNDWEHVIQISDRLTTTNVALLDNGTIAVGDLSDDTNGENDRWLEDIQSWKNIVKIAWDGTDNRAGYGGLVYVSIFGLDSNGKVLGLDHAYRDGVENQQFKEYLQFFGRIRNIKDIQVSNPVSALDDNETLYILKEDGTIRKIQGVRDWWNKYYVDSKNNLLSLDSPNRILEGIVYVNNGYCVSQSGTVYDIDGNPMDVKTEIKDCWIER